MEVLLSVSVISSCIASIWRAKIKEKARLKRIDKLKDLKECQINAIGEYEKKSSFWSRFRKEK